MDLYLLGQTHRPSCSHPGREPEGYPALLKGSTEAPGLFFSSLPSWSKSDLSVGFSIPEQRAKTKSSSSVSAYPGDLNSSTCKSRKGLLSPGKEVRLGALCRPVGAQVWSTQLLPCKWGLLVWFTLKNASCIYSIAEQREAQSTFHNSWYPLLPAQFHVSLDAFCPFHEPCAPGLRDPDGWAAWCARESRCPMSRPRLIEDMSSGLGGGGSPGRPTGAGGPGSSCNLAACLIRLHS